MKVALIGYGKMDREIEKAALSHGHEIVSIIDINNQDDFESEVFESTDVAIEFTNPMVACSNYMRAFKTSVKLALGDTEWMTEHGDEVKELCNKGGKTLFWSPNSSLDVAIFPAVNEYLAKMMNQSPAHDVTMNEIRHAHKLDAPSGTAIMLVEDILENMEHKNAWVKEEAHSASELLVHSTHEGEVFGIHAIRYDSEAGSISVTHDAKNQGGFVLGVVLAAEYTATREGYPGMSNLFPFLKD